MSNNNNFSNQKINNTFIPSISDRYHDNITDTISYLFQSREVFLFGAIDTEQARTICAQIFALYSQNKETPISLYINCPGGSIYDGLAIIDAMNFTKIVDTYIIGSAMSMGFLIAIHGRNRYMSINSTMLIHQPLISGSRGRMQETDIRIEAQEMLFVRQLIEKMIIIQSKNNSIIADNINKYTERDYFLRAEEAKSLGLIDRILFDNN